jgi:arsenate reductase
MPSLNNVSCMARSHSPQSRGATLAFRLAGAVCAASAFATASWGTAIGINIVVTVCDAAAAEQCSYWPGSPVKIQWCSQSAIACDQVGRQTVVDQVHAVST